VKELFSVFFQFLKQSRFCFGLVVSFRIFKVAMAGVPKNVISV